MNLIYQTANCNELTSESLTIFFIGNLVSGLQIQNHENRFILGLDHCDINSSGKDGEIKETCPNVEELDLSSNLFTEWSQVSLTFVLYIQGDFQNLYY